MDDVLLLVANVLLASPTPENLLAFVKLQATHRGVWTHFKHDRALWTRLQALLPMWSLPEHLGLRRRVITGIKLLLAKCIACHGPAPRVFMAFQARLCRRCCERLLISDFQLAWQHGMDSPVNTAYIVRYAGTVRVRFYLRQHLPALPSPVKLTRAQQARFYRRWPGLRAVDVSAVVRRMT
jgi:hypothetical protein